MLNKKIAGLVLMAALSVGLVGCGSDSESDSTAVSYIQYYNASANSTSTSLVLDDYSYTAINFADAMPRYEYPTGTAEVSIVGKDADADALTVFTDNIALNNDTNHLFVLSGDYHSPDFLDITYSRTEMDEINNDDDSEESKMQVLIANVANDNVAFDAYISTAAQTFAEATLLGSLAYKQTVTEQMFDTGSYIVYLTQPGSDTVVYTTGTMALTTETVYKLMIRNSYGPSELGVTIDSVDSTTTSTNYSGLETVAQYQVYNGLTSRNIDAVVASKQESQYLYDIAPATISAFQQIAFNDYGISLFDSVTKETLFDNLLVTFNQDETKTVLIYDDADGKTQGMVIEQDLRPRAFEYKVDMTNLSSDYDDLQVYFVRNTETIETAEYYLKDLDFVEQLSTTLPTGDYEINIVHKADNGTLTLIYQSEAISLTGEGNFSFVLTKDATSRLGHRLVQLTGMTASE